MNWFRQQYKTLVQGYIAHGNVDCGVLAPDVTASATTMGRFKRRRNLDLRPLSELHDEFAGRPRAEALLTDAEAELTRRERTEVAYAEPHSAGAQAETCWRRLATGAGTGPR